MYLRKAHFQHKSYRGTHAQRHTQATTYSSRRSVTFCKTWLDFFAKNFSAANPSYPASGPNYASIRARANRYCYRNITGKKTMHLIDVLAYSQMFSQLERAQTRMNWAWRKPGRLNPLVILEDDNLPGEIRLSKVLPAAVFWIEEIWPSTLVCPSLR